MHLRHNLPTYGHGRRRECDGEPAAPLPCYLVLPTLPCHPSFIWLRSPEYPSLLQVHVQPDPPSTAVCSTATVGATSTSPAPGLSDGTEEDIEELVHMCMHTHAHAHTHATNTKRALRI